MLVRHRHQFPVELLDDEAHQEVGGGVFLRHDNEKGLLAGTKLLGVDGAVEAEDLFQLTVQKCVETAHGGGEDRQHGLFPRVESCPRQPSRLVVIGEQLHEQLELALALDLAGGQQVLKEFEYRHNVLFLLRKELGHQQDQAGEQSLRRVVEIGVLAVVLLPIHLDDGLGTDFGVLLHLGPGPQILGIFLHPFRVLGHQVEHIGPIGAGGISQVDHRHLIAIALLCDGAVVAVDVAFGVGHQKAHPGGAGVLQIGVEVVGGLAHAGSADHQAVNIRRIDEGGGLFPPHLGTDNQALLFRQVTVLPPLLRKKGNRQVGVVDLLRGRPASGPVLAVPHWAGLETVQAALPGEEGEDRKNRHNHSGGQENVRKGRKIKGEHGIPPFSYGSFSARLRIWM